MFEPIGHQRPYLRTREEIQEILERGGYQALRRRRTGLSTAQVMEYLAQAMRNPGLEVYIHEPGGSPKDSRDLLRYFQTIVRKLSLHGFEVNREHNSVRFTLDEPTRPRALEAPVEKAH